MPCSNQLPHFWKLLCVTDAHPWPLQLWDLSTPRSSLWFCFPRLRQCGKCCVRSVGKGEQHGRIVRNRMLLLAGSEQGFCVPSVWRELCNGKQVTLVGRSLSSAWEMPLWKCYILSTFKKLPGASNAALKGVLRMVLLLCYSCF